MNKDEKSKEEVREEEVLNEEEASSEDAQQDSHSGEEKTGSQEQEAEEIPEQTEPEAQEKNPEAQTEPESQEEESETEAESENQEEESGQQAESESREEPDQQEKQAKPEAAHSGEEKTVRVKVNRKVSVELPESLKNIKLELPKKRINWKKLLRKPGFYIFLPGAFGLIWFLADQIRLSMLPAGDIGFWFGIGALLMALAWMLLLKMRNRRLKVIGALLSMLVFACAYLCSEVFNPISDCLKVMAYHSEEITQNPGIYAAKAVPVKDLKQLNKATVGVLKDRSQNLNSYVIQQLEDQDIHVKVKEYSSLQALIRGLKGQAVRAAVLNDADLAAADQFSDLKESVKDLSLVKQFPVDTGIRRTELKADLYQQPFTFLVAASDTDLSEKSFVADAIGVISVNPQTRQVLNIQIPRNYQVQTACPQGIDCPAGAMDKVSLTSLYTIESLRASLEQFLGTDIQFLVRIDTSKLSQLADLYSPVMVTGSYGYSSGSYTFKEGEQEMNGAMMRRFISDRNDFTSDDQYMQPNTVSAIDALRQAVKPKSILDYKPTMKVLASSVATSFTYNELLDLLKMFEFEDFHWNIQDVVLQVQDGWEYSPSLTTPAYTALGTDENANQVRACIKQLLDGQVPQVPAVQTQVPAQDQAEEGSKQEQSEAETSAEDAGSGQDSQNEQYYAEQPSYSETYTEPYGSDSGYQNGGIQDSSGQNTDPGSDQNSDQYTDQSSEQSSDSNAQQTEQEDGQQ
ncbi:MAG: LCP family protein [Ileibacterium sp.]|nr:LCP family protein [Ileibacterium sp.]